MAERKSGSCFGGPSRRTDTLLALSLEERNRRHPLGYHGESGAALIQAAAEHLAFLESRIEGLEAQALQEIESDPALDPEESIFARLPALCALRLRLRLLRVAAA